MENNNSNSLDHPATDVQCLNHAWDPNPHKAGFQVLTSTPLSRVCAQSEGSFSTCHEHVNHSHSKKNPDKISLGYSIMHLTSAASVYAETEVTVWGWSLQGELLYQKPLCISISATEKISCSGSLEPLIFGLSLEDCGQTFTHLSTTGRMGSTDWITECDRYPSLFV